MIGLKLRMDILGPILFYITTQLSSQNNAQKQADMNLLSAKSISLEKRYNDKFVDDVFRDNILLNIAYLSGKVSKSSDIKWEEIRKPFEYEFTLMPDKTFAFHGDVLGKYKDSLAITTNAHFSSDQGFKSDGVLVGNGVCHLASLMYWVSKTAGLEAYAPTNHDFALIPEIDREFGVSIYKIFGNENENSMQNLYITNNRKSPVIFRFTYEGVELRLAVFTLIAS